MSTRFARIAGLIAGVLALILRAAPALPVTVVPLTLKQMQSRSSQVILGTVEDTYAAWDKDHRLIETHVRVRVERRLKGQGGTVVQILVPGGVVGDTGMMTPGAPVFHPGDRVLILAEPRGPSGDVRPVGFFQGKLDVKRDASGADVVEAPGPAWGSRGERLPAGAMPPGAIPALPLDDVIRKLGGGP